jgi:hypothetical protein
MLRQWWRQWWWQWWQQQQQCNGRCSGGNKGTMLPDNSGNGVGRQTTETESVVEADNNQPSSSNIGNNGDRGDG